MSTFSRAHQASSYAIAANGLDILDNFGDRNFDMEDMFKNEEKWADRSQIYGDEWWHSDIWNVSYAYVNPAFKKIVNITETE